MKTMKIDNAIVVTVDMRNSSSLISNDNNLSNAEDIITNFNRIIIENRGNTITAQSTGDGYILVYDANHFKQYYNDINELKNEISSYIDGINRKLKTNKLGFGIGIQISPINIIEKNIDGERILLLIGQCVNTSSKYAYLHNRDSLQHNHFKFNGFLTTKSFNTFLENNGFEVGELLSEYSNIIAVKLERIIFKEGL